MCVFISYYYLYIYIQDEILSIFANTALSPKEICGRILGKKCDKTYDPFNQTWTIPVPKGKPPIKPYPTPKVYVFSRIINLYN